MHETRIALREEIDGIDNIDELRAKLIQSTEMMIALTFAMNVTTGAEKLSSSDAQLMLELAADYELDTDVRIS